jgi:hypothetical protein
MRPARCLVLICIAYALAGCGASAKEQVEAKVEQFAHATASHEYRTLCTQVLAPALVKHLTGAGISCDEAMRVFATSVQNPTISISKVTIKGSSASAVVLAGATGQTAALESVQLVDTSNGWRLASLASPQ